MNVHVPPPKMFEVEMSADGEVLIPEPVRRGAGLFPGMRLVMGINDRGEAVLMTRTQANRMGETPEERRARIRAAIESIAGTVDTGFATTDDYMDFIRPHRHDPV